MARPRAILDTHGHGDRIPGLLETEPPGITRERLLAIQAALEGDKKITEIAKDLGRSQQTISSWMKWFREEGTPGLLERPGQGKGRESELPPSLRKELLKKVAKGSFRRAKDVKKWLDGRKGARKEGYELGAVYKYLKMCGASLKVPRPRNEKKNEAAAASFKSTLARKIHELGLPKSMPLRVWVSDEARIGLHPTLRKCWVKCGCRAHKNSKTKYDWRYVWGALQIGGGGSEFLYTNCATTEASLEFLRQISRRDPGAMHVVIWDGAGFHPSEEHPGIPENVRVLRQPPYSPELNAVEKLWDMLRDELCNRGWRQGIEEQLKAVTKFLKEFWSDGRNVLSLVGDGWMRAQVNAC